MLNLHQEMKIIQRSAEQSTKAAAAYQSNQKLYSGYDQSVKHSPEK